LEQKNKIVWGLETGLNGGSLSVVQNGREIESRSGLTTLSKSEDILFLLEEILRKHAIRRENINLIAISSEHGSLTGNRIGMAISKGLADAFSAEIVSVSLLKILARQNGSEKRIVSAILTNKNSVIFEEFRSLTDGNIVSESPPVNIDPAGFIKKLRGFEGYRIGFVVSGDLFKIIKEETLLDGFHKASNVSVAEGNWAKLIAFYGEENRVR
jgi:tRNA A37 threonylcarbamoyladenosine modification protein TsaB